MPEEAFDLSSSTSTIPPAKKPKETAVSWSSHCVNKKSPSDYARDRVEKYKQYFKDGEILPIPELVEAVEPKTLSFVVTDIKTKRLAGIKKETFEDLLKTANIPGKYFCRRSFATWDVLLPSEEAAKKLAGGNITTRFFRLQPEYRGKRRIRVTVCNVSMQLSGDVLAAYLSIYGGVEQVTQVTSTRGTAYGDYVFVMCLDRGGFNNIPHKIKYRDQTMTVIVEGRKPLCWSCNKIGHFSKNCLLGELKTLGVDVAALQETHFTCGADSRVLEGNFNVFSAYGSRTSVGVSLLVGRSLDADVDVVFAGDGGRLVVADVAVKSFKFCLVAVYASNIAAERVSFFRRLAPFLDVTKRLVLMGDWNAILDPKIDKRAGS